LLWQQIILDFKYNTTKINYKYPLGKAAQKDVLRDIDKQIQ